MFFLGGFAFLLLLLLVRQLHLGEVIGKDGVCIGDDGDVALVDFFDVRVFHLHAVPRFPGDEVQRGEFALFNAPIDFLCLIAAMSVPGEATANDHCVAYISINV